MAPGSPMGRILQVNVSPRGGLPKFPVEGPVRVLRTGVEGDFNRYRATRLAGDPDSALLLLPISTIEEYAREGYPVGPGSMGENITLGGISEDEMAPGQVYRLGRTVEAEIRRPCTPCHELAVFGESLVRRAMGRRGYYAKVLQEGEITAGEAVVLLRR